MMKARHWLYAAVPLTAAFFSFCLIINALWIPLKAELAQLLIERSWRNSLAGEEDARPWPWADTVAAARLSAPRLGVHLIVLEGNSGRNLAFGPVFLDGTANGRDMVISGHRDTHFRHLELLRPGDRLGLTRPDGEHWYEVRDLEVVDSRYSELVIEPGVDRLSLVTCYPFDSPLTGGPLRYVVTALPVKQKRWLSSG